jgi:putative hydrolase of the HAD superfamily
MASSQDRRENMNRAEVISFDLDGTLTDMSFVDSVWLQGIPKLYAVKNQISFEEARRKVKNEYDRVGKERLEWYDLNYWLNKFEIDASPQQVLDSFRERIRLFEEVPNVLEELKNRGYRLIVVTNARREFADMEIAHTGIRKYFEKIFSSPSDFRLTKNGTNVYERVCAACDVSPSAMVHVGDDREFDFEVPRRLGINAFLLDRTRKKSGPFTVTSLEDFESMF